MSSKPSIIVYKPYGFIASAKPKPNKLYDNKAQCVNPIRIYKILTKIHTMSSKGPKFCIFKSSFKSNVSAVLKMEGNGKIIFLVCHGVHLTIQKRKKTLAKTIIWIQPIASNKRNMYK